MSRGAYNFCPRSSMPAAPLLEPDHTATKPAGPAVKHAPETMTWQQQEEFGTSKPSSRSRVKWKPFQEPAIEEPVNNSWTEQQAEFPAQVSSSRRRARGKATTTSPSPIDAKRSPPAHLHSSPTLARLQSNTTKNTISPRNNKQSKKKTLPQPDKMVTPAVTKKIASIPPHLRKQNAAVEAKKEATSKRATPAQPRQIEKAQKKNGAVSMRIFPTEQVGVQEYAGWDTPKPQPPARSRFGNPKQCWQGGPPRAPRVPWPKARDMKPLPSESGSEGGVGFKSDSNGDVDYDIKKLLDWKGDWMPAPETWAARKGYSDRHFTDTIDKWINISARYGRSITIDEPAFSGRKAVGGATAEYVVGKTIPGEHEYNELVPRSWVEPRVEDKTLREYWTDMPKIMPQALEDCDIMADPPWWDRYQDSSNYITSLTVPEAKVNMLDKENPVKPYQLACAEDKLNAILQRRRAAYNETMAKRHRPAPKTKDWAPPVQSRSIVPMANVYIRPVQPADVRGIAEIYNYYIDNSIYANEFDGRTEDQIRRRISVVTSAGLPFLVAVAKGNQPKNHVNYIAEKIVGFISLDDYVDQSSMFRFTFDMELYVHPGFVQKRIAKCLLDKLLDLANTGYAIRGGYDYKNEFEYLKTGPSRVVKTILLNVHHESGKEIEWQSKLLNDFGFKRCGRMPGVGYKHDKVVDISTFSYQTTELINAAGRPSVGLERD
ncbi:hypothetical protein T440DRAFT_407371 [Plenodomus tracheiphilus IPT5]|uniref:N-acetyltransferase domain-containing protein n=1 Tax=Plenodomus tracheiphilus IPT5 TaxID=1408161 RepID=A0A6A7ATI8_9PLEO|nr:hypothetical protein T440DRAFT_407371 [Plenodomus tracheiphilus IPT5]